jgi:hypothetical protein
MLNSVIETNKSKKKNKVKVNVKKMIFYNFDALNAQITKKKNLLVSLTSAPIRVGNRPGQVRL